jgi:hypothetical protein
MVKVKPASLPRWRLPRRLIGEVNLGCGHLIPDRIGDQFGRDRPPTDPADRRGRRNGLRWSPLGESFSGHHPHQPNLITPFVKTE